MRIKQNIKGKKREKNKRYSDLRGSFKGFHVIWVAFLEVDSMFS